MDLLKKVDLQLFVNNEWVVVDIDQSESFAFTLQASDVTNPTITKIPFSVEIALPKTHKNNDIFSMLCSRYDANIKNINPLLRTDFRLYINADIYQEGYMKVESVDWLANKINIRLFGSLGDYFYLMSEVSDERNMQLKNLDFGELFNHTVNKDYVNLSFTTNGGFNHSSYGTNIATYFDYSTGSNITEEVFNYAMTYSGLYDNFDSGYLTDGLNEDQRSEVDWQASNKHYTAGRDISEHERSHIIDGTQYFGEYRSYMQKPAIKVKPVICKILEKMDAEGWKTELDPTFFNRYNPYWNDLWMILPNYETSNDSTGDSKPIPRWDSKIFNHTTSISDTSVLNLGYEYFEATDYSLSFNIPFYLLTRQTSGDNDAIRKYLQTTIEAEVRINNAPIGKLIYTHDNEEQLSLNESTTCQKNVTNFKNETGQGNTNNPFYIFRRDTSNSNAEQNISVSGITTPYSSLNPDPATATEYVFAGGVNFSNTVAGNKVIEVVFTVTGVTNWTKRGSSNTNNHRGRSLQIRVFPDSGTYSVNSSDGSGTRTGKNITYKDIIRSEDTCYDFFMSYMKPFGMHFIKDKASKTVSVVTRNTYYGNLERSDWTHKIDYNKQHTMQPVPFDYKIGVLKWLDSGSKYEEDYISKTSREYGSARFNTNYQFNDDENNYLDSNIINNAIVATGYSNYFLGRNTTIYKDNKTLLHLQDKADEGISINYIFAFLDGRTSVSYPFRITDDNAGMLLFGYSWTNDTNVSIPCSNYPNFTRTINIGQYYSLNFGRPSITYEGNDIEGDSTTGGETIYSRFWSGYFSDRFSKECQLLTCYVNLSVSDIQSDLFRRFIFIRDTVWVINKIIHFNPCSPAPTKVELIKVQDINAYVSQDYIAGNLVINITNDGDGNNLGTVYNYVDGPNINPYVLRVDSSARTITFEIVPDTDWYINSFDGLTISPQSGTGGITTNLTATLTENTTGSPLTSFFNIRWGNITTIVQIVQLANWTVTTSVNPLNTGTTNANGGGETGEIISVADGTSVTLSVEPNQGYTLNYWLINGNYFYTPNPSFSVTEDVIAVAYLYEATTNVQLSTTDTYTQVQGEPKYGSYYWILESGQIYTFENTQPNLSGYAFSDGVLLDPNNTFTKSFTNNDTLNVYYDSLLVNVIIVNNSRADFDSANVTITTPSGIPVAVFGGSVGAGMAVQRGIIYPSTEYGLYILGSTDDDIHEVEFSQNTITYSKGMAVPTITITLTSAFTPELDIQPRQMTVGPNITVYTIDLTCNTTWQCKVDEIYDGIVNVAPLFGTGDATVTVTTGVNPTSNQRTGIATFETTYGQDDVFINHTVTQRPLNGTLNINIENLTSNTIRPTSNITGNISRGNTVIDQFTIFDVPSTGSIYDFTLQEGDYVISLSSYSGISNNGTYTISPATSQSISLLGGSNEDVTYTFSEESSAVLLTINFSNDVSTIGLFLNTPDPNNTNYYQLELVYDNTITYRYNRNTGLTINNGSTSTGSTNVFPGGTILVYSYNSGIYTRLGSFVLSGNDQTITLP